MLVRRSIKVKVAVAAMCAAAASLTGCTTSSGTAEKTSGSGDLSGTVYFMLPNTTTVRFTQNDAPAFVHAMKAIAPHMKVDVVNGENKADTQMQQAETAISKNAKAIVYVAADPTTAGGLVAKVNAAGIPIIDYEHGVESKDITYHVQNSPVEVGAAIGKTFTKAVSKSGKPLRIARLYGNKGDDYTTREKQGQDAYINKLVSSGKVKVVCDDYVANWQPSVAQQLAEQCLTRTQNKVDAFVVMNDGTATGAVAALQGQGLQGKVPVYGGQDATLDGIKYMLRGWIEDTVYKPFDKEAGAAAELVKAAITGKKPPAGLINDKAPDGRPRASLTVVDLTPKNVDLVVKDKLYTKAQLCKGVKDVTGYC
jgi:D-xylose transport system substrate-binding protein